MAYMATLESMMLAQNPQDAGPAGTKKTTKNHNLICWHERYIETTTSNK
jgi:hypothetical protein